VNVETNDHNQQARDHGHNSNENFHNLFFSPKVENNEVQKSSKTNENLVRLLVSYLSYIINLLK